MFTARAKGALVEDVDGNVFIDLAGGIGCLNVGHAPDPLLKELHEQADRFLHAAFSVSPYEGYVRLAERLNQLTPGNFAKKTLLVNTGAEAIENAIKLARAYTKRFAVICFDHAFHGRSLLALSLTSKSDPYKVGFGPFVPDIYRIPYAYCYRCAYHLEYPSCGLSCAHQLEEVLHRVVSAESVAAVIAEPVLGEGGFMAPPPDFFKELVAICRKKGILFIADEVQTGIARTGTLFACEQYGIEPDLLVSSKSLGGGLPIAAVTGRAEIMIPRHLAGLAVPTTEIPWPVRLLSRFWNSWKKRNCASERGGWANTSSRKLHSGKSAGLRSVRSMVSAPCARSSLCVMRTRGSLLPKKRNPSCGIVMSEAC